MEILFLCIIAFLFLLAIFDLSVGVSNDAVNFLNSAIGAKAASFKRILIVAAIGVFIGASMSNGMMDIARHGIFRPEHFSFYDLICIFMAVMITDIILLDIFNSLGMPTSTTVSMVFELLGATFVVSIIKIADGFSLGLDNLINTEKALSVIIGIFLSVGIAFFFGTIVQFISRLIFSFNYKSNLKWKIGIFGGICTTAIIYFLLIKGAKNLTFMTPEMNEWISTHTATIIFGCFLAFSCLMQLLHAVGVNVLKVIVLLGTFALAMAFAGNDLVNFIGVPLAGLSSYQDYAANGGGESHSFLMNSLNGPSNTPIFFLIAAGVIMVISLATSEKVKKVTETAIGLSSQQNSDEMFGSSRIARRLVRWTISSTNLVCNITPPSIRNWVGKRFNVDEAIMEQGAAFDLIRGSINLVLAGALIALGTSLKLPLSTTFVTFMVAMGTSLSDRAWGRESAVFRITGVISVIGGWFITAGAAFIGAGLIVAAMHYGGEWIMIALAILTLIFIVKNNFRKKEEDTPDKENAMVQAIVSTTDSKEAWHLLLIYIREQQSKFIKYAGDNYNSITDAFIRENAGSLYKTETSLSKEKAILKNQRRKETLCLRYVAREVAIEKSAWFYLCNNCCMGILYNLRRINEICKEHVDNNFLPLPSNYKAEYETTRQKVVNTFNEVNALMDAPYNKEQIFKLRQECDNIKDRISMLNRKLHDDLQSCDTSSLTVIYVYVNMLQETQEMISSLRKYLRGYAKLLDSEFKAHRTV